VYDCTRTLSLYPKSNSSLIQYLKERKKTKKKKKNPNLHYEEETLILLSSLRTLASCRGN